MTKTNFPKRFLGATLYAALALCLVGFAEAEPTPRQSVFIQGVNHNLFPELVPVEPSLRLASPESCERPAVLTRERSMMYSAQMRCADIALKGRRALVRMEAAQNALQILVKELETLKISKKQMTSDVENLFSNEGASVAFFLKYLAVEKAVRSDDCDKPQAQCAQSSQNSVPSEQISLVATLKPKALSAQSLISSDVEALAEQDRLLEETLRFLFDRPNVFQTFMYALKIFAKSDDYLIEYPEISYLQDKFKDHIAVGIERISSEPCSGKTGFRLTFGALGSENGAEVEVCSEKRDILPYIEKYFSGVEKKLLGQQARFQAILNAQERLLASEQASYESERCVGFQAIAQAGRATP